MAAMRQQELSPEEKAEQAALTRSWEHAQQALADPKFRAQLEDSIERVNRSTATTVMTGQEFLAQTAHVTE